MTVKIPDLPEVVFTATGLVRDDIGSINYDSIAAITFKTLPLLQNRISRAFFGFDRIIVFGSSNWTPRLALHLVDERTIWLSRGRDLAIPSARAEALCAAAEFLLERTFDRRFAKYREQFEAEDRFFYGRYCFCRNGDILKRDRRLYNVHDTHFYILLGPFHVHLEHKATLFERLRATVGQLGHTIDIGRDRDCFLSMYRLAYGTYWPDEHYRDGAWRS